MRSSVDLVELDYSFSQLPLLMADQLIRELANRGLNIAEHQLEALHRARLLVPLLRVHRDTRALARGFARGDSSTWDVAYWRPTTRRDILVARELRLLRDPAAERFITPRRIAGGPRHSSYASDVYLYSQHQLVAVPTIKRAVPHITSKRDGDEIVSRVHIPHRAVDLWRSDAAALRDVAIAASALEARYYPDVVGTVRFPRLTDIDAYEPWRRTLPVKQTLSWLGVDAQWLADVALGLLRRARQLDPLGSGFAELLAHADSETWTALRGDARSALDHRATAELLLRYHDHLVRTRQAQRLERSHPRRQAWLDWRLKPSRAIDEVLTDLGLSAQPRLVLVVEGDTEVLLAPRAMVLLGINTDQTLIDIQNSEGVGASLTALMGFLAPRVVAQEDGRYLRLSRPATRVFVVLDPEGVFATEAAREARRASWIDRIMRALPREHRTAAVRLQIEPLVEVETWNRRGESFEFAHFTDRQIATAILALPGHRRSRTIKEMTELVAGARERHDNLKSLVPGKSKTRLAEALWPTLERKINVAIRRGTESRIPVVRVLDRAHYSALELPRKGLVIALEPHSSE